MSVLAAQNDSGVVALTAPLDNATSICDAPAAGSGRRLLGQELIGANLVDPEELEAALKLQAERGQPLGETLLEMGILSEKELLPFIERQLGVKAIQLREGVVDPAALRLIPRATGEQLGAVGLFVVRGELTVAMVDPLNLDAIDRLERVTGLTVRNVFAFRKGIRRMLDRGYQADFEVDAVTADMSEDAVELQASNTEFEINTVEQLVEGSPVINLVNYLILQAIRHGASDIHIEPGRKFTTVRFRIDGQLVETLRPRRDIHPAVTSRIKVMAKLDIAEQRSPQDGRCQVIVDKRDIDLRVSVLPTVLGEKVVMRVLDKQRLTFDLNKLGVPEGMLGQMKQLLAKPHGLLLVTGPTGSGKTTTLYSALELIKSVNWNLMTVEDPVEYQVELVNQVQVDTARKISFASALRSILRQDPDVIMIGEIRDAETASLAVEAALTGHLVLSTLHTNDAVGSVVRMTDMGIEPYKLSAALVGVIAQRLLRTVCPKCRSTYFPSSDYLKALHYQGDTRRSFTRGEGCRDCFDTGFKGRIGIYELLEVTSEVRRMISSQADLDVIRQWSKEQGNQSLLDCGIALAERGVTSLEEAARVALFD